MDGAERDQAAGRMGEGKCGGGQSGSATCCMKASRSRSMLRRSCRYGPFRRVLRAAARSRPGRASRSSATAKPRRRRSPTVSNSARSPRPALEDADRAERLPPRRPPVGGPWSRTPSLVAISPVTAPSGTGSLLRFRRGPFRRRLACRALGCRRGPPVAQACGRVCVCKREKSTSPSSVARPAQRRQAVWLGRSSQRSRRKAKPAASISGHRRQVENRHRRGGTIALASGRGRLGANSVTGRSDARCIGRRF